MSGSSTYRKYDFACESCKKEYSDMMWVNRGEPTGVKCPSCETLNMPITKVAVNGVMINKREDWTKKLPGGWTDFLSSFEKRHSKYGRKINSHKKGTSS